MRSARDRLTRVLSKTRAVAGIRVELWRWEGQGLRSAVLEVVDDLQGLAQALQRIADELEDVEVVLYPVGIGPAGNRSAGGLSAETANRKRDRDDAPGAGDSAPGAVSEGGR